MCTSGLVDTLVTHAKMKGLGLTHLFGDHRGFMPPQLKTTIDIGAPTIETRVFAVKLKHHQSTPKEIKCLTYALEIIKMPNL